MPVVTIDLLTGREPAKKEALAGRITQAFQDVLGTKPENLNIIFNEVTRDSWAVNGKLLSSGDKG